MIFSIEALFYREKKKKYDFDQVSAVTCEKCFPFGYLLTRSFISKESKI